MALDTLYINPSKTIAMKVFPGVVLQVLNGPVTRAHLEHALPMLNHPIVGDRYVELCRGAPTEISHIPDDEFRKLAAVALKQQSGRLLALAYVMAGEGFLTSLAHMVIAGVSLVARTSHAQQVFSEPLPAANWLATHSPGGKAVPAEIVRELDKLVALTR